MSLRRFRRPSLNVSSMPILPSSDDYYEGLFYENYNVPWTISEKAYFLAYCADVDIDIVRGSIYKRILLYDYKDFSDEDKESILGILYNSYPFISMDEMIKKLVDAGVLVQKKFNHKIIYTVKSNELATKTITSDELVSAIQLAIHNFTNPGQITELYYKTAKLSSNTILRESNLWVNEYDAGYYEEVKNNIYEVYNYLITLKAKDISQYISEVQVKEKDDKSYTLYVKLNKEINDKDDLKIVVYEDDEKLVEHSLKDNQKDSDGNYVINVDSSYNKDKIKVAVEGQIYDTNADVYEAYEGNEVSQRLIGLSLGYRTISRPYASPIGDYVDKNANLGDDVNADNTEKNPNTSDYILVVSVIAILSLGVITFIKRKSF